MRGLVARSRGSPHKRNASKIGPVWPDTGTVVWTWQITLKTRPAHCSPAPIFPDAPYRGKEIAGLKPRAKDTRSCGLWMRGWRTAIRAGCPYGFAEGRRRRS